MRLDDLDTERDLDINRPADAALASAVADWQSAVEQLRQRAQWLSRDLESAIRQCDAALAGEPFAINGCGIVQGTGREIDRLCGDLEIHGKTLRMLLRLRKQLASS